MTTKTLLFIFGTRPETIKMAPLILAAQQHPDFTPKVCLTGQHKEMVTPILDFFSIRPDYSLNVMTHNQTLSSLSAKLIEALDPIIEDSSPDTIIVQGDTSTALMGALVGFYHKIPITHLEAGLRSHNIYSPFPEEANRKLIGSLTTIHLPPTKKAADALKEEGIKDNIFTVGNSVIDALQIGLATIQKKPEKYSEHISKLNIPSKSTIILVTGHRRESFGEPFEELCKSLKHIASTFPECHIVYPVHLNPNVQNVVNKKLSNISNIHLIPPLDYPELLFLLNESYIVITDSGGIQEEAPSLGKPVIVTRDVTERTEGIDAGTAKLVGTNADIIIENVTTLLTDRDAYNTISKTTNPYGDGTTSQKVLECLKKSL